MLKRSMCSALMAALCAGVVWQPVVKANDQAENQRWEDQETWTQFAEKERAHSFKMSTPRANPKRPPTVLESVLSGNQPSLVPTGLSQPAAPANAGAGNFSVPQYICMPGQAPAVQQPFQRVETTIVPVIHRNSIVLPSIGFGGPSYGWGGWGANRYWGTGWGRANWGGGWGAGSPGWLGGGDPVIGYRVQTRTRQVGPSRSSGNYYMPSTPDPSASGNYYASPTPPPVAMPVIYKEPDAKDNWGKTGSPLPADMQPQ